jgi:hypothetical protein
MAWENGLEPAHTRPDTKGVLVEKSERENTGKKEI